MNRNIKLRVKNLVKKYRTCDPFQLADDLGITVLRLALPDDIRGFLVYTLRRKYIVLNESLCYAAQKIIVCHELGHARLHPHQGYYLSTNSRYYSPTRYEREANEFALHLLSYSCDMDSDELSRIIEQRRPDPREVHFILGRFVDSQCE